MNRDTQSVLLLLVGGAIVRIGADDTFLRYVRPWTRPYLMAAGIVLIVLSLASLAREHARRRPPPAPTPGDPGNPVGAGWPAAAVAGHPAETDHHDDHDRGDQHDHRHGPVVAWLLLLPVFAIFLVAPPALGSFAASRQSNNIVKPAGDEFAALPAGDPVSTTLTDYATRAVWDAGRTLQGRRIRLVGFVSPRPGGGYYLTRLVITCCAADARPIKIAVQGDPVARGADGWVAVVGRYGGFDKAAAKTEQIPVIRAVSATPVTAPPEPYES